MNLSNVNKHFLRDAHKPLCDNSAYPLLKTGIMKTLADRLTYAMAVRDISQADLAQRIGVSQQSVSYLCTKGRKSVHVTTIAKVLNINPHWLANGTGSMEDVEESGNPVKGRIIKLLEAAQEVIDKSGEAFSEEELMSIYMDALEFGGKQGFSEKLVKFYLTEMMAKRKK